MTVHEGMGTGMTDSIPPPVNNACVPDIYNKLDANAIEKTKVMNMQLNYKLKIQEKVLTKYRNAAEQRYTRERDKLRMDLRNICRRMPNYADIPKLETKVKKLRKGKKAKYAPKHDCVFTTEPLDMKGISEKDEKPFCDRFLTHHLPTKSRFYQDVLHSVKKGMSMPDLRPRPSDRYRRVVPLQSHHLSQDSLSPPTDDSLSPKLLPVIKSLDDTYLSSKSRLLDDDDDDDDIKTV
ncbi:uncharacterized protein LOC132715263 [Ruditapes philippinarum]|uniref:uncharacterized protein LOC132715263 n=1 Tax=Ruditapes philippinarum TaxID=129788 RepID=UPI00295B77F4|nr:uncharacterized protein LOC132715263 [Ruditapes philippinarum]